MSENNKSRSKVLNKVFIIGGVIFATALTVAGILAINQSKEKGTDEVLASESELVSAMYADYSTQETVHLADDQFYAALSKVFPSDNTTDLAKRTAIHQIQTTLTNANITADVDYFNNFGQPGYRITTTTSVNDVLPLLSFNNCSKYTVYVIAEDSIGILGLYDITKDGVEVRVEQGMSIGNEESQDTITSLADGLQTEYGIDKITLTDKALLIYSYEVSTTDLLNAFDYTYQWCLENNCDRQIFLYASDQLIGATASSLADDFYKNNYPVQDLAAIFRLNYYSSSCFFGQTIQDICNLYL